MKSRQEPIILATQEAEITVQSQLRQIVCKTLSQKKTHHKKGLVGWLKVKALSSNPLLFIKCRYVI
jgi:hypothetical protein